MESFMQVLVQEHAGVIDITNRETGNGVTVFVLASGSHWLADDRGLCEVYACRRDAIQRAEMLLSTVQTVEVL